tara:strand:- start:215 stop:358 length:144 start_codon:yes stop_codon:yes gene_type:complete
MEVNDIISEHLIVTGYSSFFFWAILLIILTTALSLLWGMWLEDDDEI